MKKIKNSQQKKRKACGLLCDYKIIHRLKTHIIVMSSNVSALSKTLSITYILFQEFPRHLVIFVEFKNFKGFQPSKHETCTQGWFNVGVL